MAVELFLLPMEGNGAPKTPHRAKYTLDPSVVRWGAIRYSRTSVAVTLVEAPQGYLDSVASQPDATRMATAGTIDDTLTAGQANAVQSVFESNGIPSGFASAGDIRRAVIRTVVGLFLFSQRLEGRFGVGFWQRAQEVGVSLDTQWNDFPQALKDQFLAVRDEHGWGTLGLDANSTLRQIMRSVSEQFALIPFFIAGVEV